MEPDASPGAGFGWNVGAVGLSFPFALVGISISAFHQLLCHDYDGEGLQSPNRLLLLDLSLPYLR